MEVVWGPYYWVIRFDTRSFEPCSNVLSKLWEFPKIRGPNIDPKLQGHPGNWPLIHRNYHLLNHASHHVRRRNKLHVSLKGFGKG